MEGKRWDQNKEKEEEEDQPPSFPADAPRYAPCPRPVGGADTLRNTARREGGGEVLKTEAAQQYLLHSSQFPERLRSSQPNLSGSSNSSQSAASLISHQTGGEAGS